MGVVYKLKQEVIDFILLKKKNNPKLSVRKLSDLASETFQVNISKSSVNNILKDAQLSSSVGRRSIDTVKPKKFKIPQDKKDQMREIFVQTGFAPKEDKAATEQPAQEIKIETKPQELQGVSSTLESKSGADVEESLVAESPAAESFVAETQIDEQGVVENKATAEEALEENKEEEVAISNIIDKNVQSEKALHKDDEQPYVSSNDRVPDKGMYLEGLGLVFLKAAEWEIFDRPVIAELTRKHFRKLLPEQYDELCDALTTLHIINGEGWLGNMANHAVWPLCRLGGLHEYIISEALMNDYVNLSQSAGFEYEDYIRQAALRVYGFKIHFNNGGSVTLDAGLTQLKGKSLKETQGLFLNQALNVLTEKIISNQQMLCFQSLKTGLEFSKETLDVIACFEMHKGRHITSVSMLDQEGREISNFATALHQKRLFCVGVYPNHPLFEEILGSATENEQTHFNYLLNRAFKIREGTTHLEQAGLTKSVDALRTVAIIDTATKKPACVLLTNCIAHGPAFVAEAYIQAWPFWGEEIYPGTEHALVAGAISCNRFEDILKGFTKLVKDYFVRAYVQQSNLNKDATLLMTDVFNLKGYLKVTPTLFHARLEAPSDTGRQDLVRAMCRRINAQHIYTYAHKRLWVELL